MPMYACMHVCMYMYVCMYVCMCVHVCMSLLWDHSARVLPPVEFTGDIQRFDQDLRMKESSYTTVLQYCQYRECSIGISTCSQAVYLHICTHTQTDQKVHEKTFF